MAKINDVEGIGPAYATKLAEAGVTTTDDLLEKGAQPSGRKHIAESAGLSERQVLQWVNQVDLARVKGVGAEYAELLEASGVDTIPELARRNAANLHARMVEVNDVKKLCRRTPAPATVVGWVSQAKELPRAVYY